MLASSPFCKWDFCLHVPNDMLLYHPVGLRLCHSMPRFSFNLVLIKYQFETLETSAMLQKIRLCLYTSNHSPTYERGICLYSPVTKLPFPFLSGCLITGKKVKLVLFHQHHRYKRIFPFFHPVVQLSQHLC